MLNEVKQDATIVGRVDHQDTVNKLRTCPNMLNMPRCTTTFNRMGKLSRRQDPIVQTVELVLQSNGDRDITFSVDLNSFNIAYREMLETSYKCIVFSRYDEPVLSNEAYTHMVSFLTHDNILRQVNNLYVTVLSVSPRSSVREPVLRAVPGLTHRINEPIPQHPDDVKTIASSRYLRNSSSPLHMDPLTGYRSPSVDIDTFTGMHDLALMTEVYRDSNGEILHNNDVESIAVIANYPIKTFITDIIPNVALMFDHIHTTAGPLNATGGLSTLAYLYHTLRLSDTDALTVRALHDIKHRYHRKSKMIIEALYTMEFLYKHSMVTYDMDELYEFITNKKD